MSTQPKNLVYNNASKNRDHNIFTEEYYGGADAFIYINGVRYENISAINYSVREMQKPIYGYSSRTYDSMATGTRIVQGIIKVPVKNNGGADALNDDEIFTASMASQRQRSSVANMDTESVPDWVYKYTPDKANIATENSPFEMTNKNRGAIATVQSELNRQNGAGLEITGILDLKTKLAIAEYKRSKNITVNTECDMELENRLNITGFDTIYYTKETISLRYAPFNDSLSTQQIPPKTKVVVQGYYEDDWYLVQMDTGRKGYVKKTEVYM